MEPVAEFNAMAFFNPEGLVPAYKHAQAFAGEEGRLATMCDIVEARIGAKPGEFLWESYFTTLSAEYVGLSKDGNPIAIVAHGFGPMETLDGILAAYSHEFKDKERNNRGGRISADEFRKLEDGTYGEVSVIDLTAVWNRREYAFGSHPVTTVEITEEPLWQARLGPKWQEYVHYHEQFAREWEEDNVFEPHTKPCIIAMDGAANCSYCCRELFDRWMELTPRTAIAHLLSVGPLSHNHHQYWGHRYVNLEYRESLSCDVSCHEWWNGTRMVGIRSGGAIKFHPGLPDFQYLVQSKLDKLWRPNPEGSKNFTDGFWHLVPINGKFFTDYRKQGDGMDLYEPEHLVTDIAALPGPNMKLRTTIGGYHGFFKYGIEEVRRIAPKGVNAYTVGDVEIEWNEGNPTHHVAEIAFYKVSVDTTRRLVRRNDIYRDFDFIMKLVS